MNIMKTFLSRFFGVVVYVHFTRRSKCLSCCISSNYKCFLAFQGPTKVEALSIIFDILARGKPGKV